MEKINKAPTLNESCLFDEIFCAFNGPVREESRLFVALLESAIVDIYGTNKLQKSRAKSWINSERNKVPSFVGICEHFGIDPIDARRKILQGVSIK